MDKYELLKLKIDEAKTKSLVASDMKVFIKIVLETAQKSKDEMQELSAEQLDTIKQAIAYLETEHTKLKNDLQTTLKGETSKLQSDTKDVLRKALKALSDIEKIEVRDGVDADEDVIVDKVLAQLPKVKETILDGRKEIVEKINTGKKNDLKIEAKQVEGFDKLLTQKNLDTAIEILDTRTQYLINKTVKVDGTTITGNGTDANPLVAVGGGGGGGTVGPGTINELAYFDTANTVASLAVATYPSLTQLSYVKGVTSAIQTQLNAKAPLTTPTFVTNITTPLIIGGTAVGSNIIYKSTTGAGTAAGIAHQFVGGTDGATVAMNILNDGSVLIGDGTATIAAIGFISDTDTGLRRTGANAVQIMAGGLYTGLYVEGSTTKFGWGTATLSTGNGAGVITITGGGYADILKVQGGLKLTSNANYGFITNEAVFDSNPTSFLNYTIAGTYANFATNRFGVMNMTANAGQALTITDNATVRIDGAPTVSGAGIVQTRAHALWVVGGQSVFGGNVGIGQTTPTAVLHLKAGTATASTAPLKFTSGTLNTTAEAGAVEFLTDAFYGTITTGAARKAFVLDDGSRLTSGKIPVATTNGRLVDVTAQTGIATLKVDYIAGELDTEAKIITALNTTNTAINTLRTALNALKLTTTI